MTDPTDRLEELTQQCPGTDWSYMPAQVWAGEDVWKLILQYLNIFWTRFSHFVAEICSGNGADGGFVFFDPAGASATQFRNQTGTECRLSN